MKVWVIRDIHTGLYFPEPGGRQGRGGSFSDPDQYPSSDNVRLFRSKLSASRFIGAWCRGKFHHSSGHYSSQDGDEYYEEVNVEHIPTRNRDNLEIIEKEILLG